MTSEFGYSNRRQLLKLIELDLDKYILELIQKHDLSFGEILLILNNVNSNYVRMLHKTELEE